MTKAAEIFKENLAAALEKVGSNLLDFEDALANMHTAAGLQKAANILESIKSIGSGLFVTAPQLALASALLAGSGVGAGLYAADRHIGDQDKRIDAKRQEAGRIQGMTQKLKSDYGLGQPQQ